LDAGVEVGEADIGEAGGAGRNGLEKAVEDAVARGADACYGGIVELACMLERHLEVTTMARKLTSRMIKKMRSRPFRTTRIQNSHHVAALGKSKVKQRRGWSSKNLNSSHTPLFCGTRNELSQITKRSMHGKPVFPITMRKLPSRRGNTAFWKEIIESGVSVKPRSLNREAGVNIPLGLRKLLLGYGITALLTTTLVTGHRYQL